MDFKAIGRKRITRNLESGDTFQTSQQKHNLSNEYFLYFFYLPNIMPPPDTESLASRTVRTTDFRAFLLGDPVKNKKAKKNIPAADDAKYAKLQNDRDINDSDSE
jgi:hypothetical protein